MNAPKRLPLVSETSPLMTDNARLAGALDEALTKLASASAALLMVQGQLGNVEITITRDVVGATPAQLSVDEYCAELLAFIAGARALPGRRVRRAPAAIRAAGGAS